MYRSALIACGALFACLAGPAAAEETKLWSGVTVTGKLAGSDRWGYRAKAELRFADHRSDTDRSVFRGAVI